MRLFIAEKPSVAKAIASELGITGRSDGCIVCGQDTVTWCFGHMLEQAEPDEYTPDDVPRTKSGKKRWRQEDLPIIPADWIVKPKPDAKQQLAVIGKLLKSADTVVNAGDPDREGQLLVDEVLEYFKNKKPVQRFWVSAQDSVSVQRGLAALKNNQDYAGFAQAALGRSRADWLIGMNLSRAYTLKAQRGGTSALLTVGRVQTPTLALVVERDRAIEAFKPIDYYRIRAEVAHADGTFTADWQAKETQEGLDSEGRLLRSEIADQLVSMLNGAQGHVAHYKEEAKRQAQPLAFSLSDITALASSKYGFSAEETLKTCQSLYETHKLASYPRTDCAYLPESQHADAPSILAALKANHAGNATVIAQIEAADPAIKSPTWNDKKITAHHGIIPTAQQGDLSALNDKERKLYDLIVRAYIAQFWPVHEYLHTQVVLEFSHETFTASGKLITQPGWKALYQTGQADQAEPGAADAEGATSTDKQENETSEQPLPAMQQGDPVTCQQAQRIDAKTKPPARFTEGTLIRAMENVHRFVENPEHKKRLREGDGIGTSATRASIIAELKRRAFLETQGKQLHSTALGKALVDALPESVKSPVLTALYERLLKAVEQGDKPLNAFVQRQEAFVRQEVEKAAQGSVNLAAVAALQQNAAAKAADNRSSKTGNIRKTSKRASGRSQSST